MKNNINSVPAICGGEPIIKNEENHFEWPIITDNTRKAVLDQLDESISLYNRSGIIEKFENDYADYHDREYALLNNSGTSAIFAMYEGIGLKPGDEVIAPTYTFFATVSPLMYTGAKPVFCDCLPDGNIDPDEIRKKITPKTKAVVVTHMWGIPCEMDEIKSICDEYGIKLLEDCSHAHGAEFKGQKVGTFGDAAAWSLQGQKIITGGEGGIMLTDDEDIYAKAQLQGHYNKRCKQEISPDHELYDFAQTGMGQKFRSHPLAIAMASEQFTHLDTWLEQKRKFANHMIEELSDIDFLNMPVVGSDKKPAWYAFVMQYKGFKDLPVQAIFDALSREGMKELDIPGSTGPIDKLPLFTQPGRIIPRFYENQVWNNGEFPNADKFYKNALKLPMWAQEKDRELVDYYIQAIKKISFAVRNNTGNILDVLSRKK